MKNDTKFTPGPWTYVPLTEACRHNPLKRFCIHTSRLATEDEREANARLMAAAPEMYEALLKVAKLFAVQGTNTAAELLLSNTVHAALAKAVPHV